MFYKKTAKYLIYNKLSNFKKKLNFPGKYKKLRIRKWKKDCGQCINMREKEKQCLCRSCQGREVDSKYPTELLGFQHTEIVSPFLLDTRTDRFFRRQKRWSEKFFFYLFFVSKEVKEFCTIQI